MMCLPVYHELVGAIINIVMVTLTSIAGDHVETFCSEMLLLFQSTGSSSPQEKKKKKSLLHMMKPWKWKRKKKSEHFEATQKSKHSLFDTLTRLFTVLFCCWQNSNLQFRPP